MKIHVLNMDTYSPTMTFTQYVRHGYSWHLLPLFTPGHHVPIGIQLGRLDTHTPPQCTHTNTCVHAITIMINNIVSLTENTNEYMEEPLSVQASMNPTKGL